MGAYITPLHSTSLFTPFLPSFQHLYFKKGKREGGRLMEEVGGVRSLGDEGKRGRGGEEGSSGKRGTKEAEEREETGLGGRLKGCGGGE